MEDQVFERGAHERWQSRMVRDVRLSFIRVHRIYPRDRVTASKTSFRHMLHLLQASIDRQDATRRLQGDNRARGAWRACANAGNPLEVSALEPGAAGCSCARSGAQLALLTRPAALLKAGLPGESARCAGRAERRHAPRTCRRLRSRDGRASG
jgi:hypothetical protein